MPFTQGKREKSCRMWHTLGFKCGIHEVDNLRQIFEDRHYSTLLQPLVWDVKKDMLPSIEDHPIFFF